MFVVNHLNIMWNGYRFAKEVQQNSRCDYASNHLKCLNFTCFVLFIKHPDLRLLSNFFLNVPCFPSVPTVFSCVSFLFLSWFSSLWQSTFTMNALSFQQITFSWTFMVANTSAFNPLYCRQMYRPTFATLNICKFGR